MCGNKKQLRFLRNNDLALFLSWSVKDLEFPLSSANFPLSDAKMEFWKMVLEWEGAVLFLPLVLTTFLKIN